MVVDIIAKNKSEKLQYQGRCKLMVDSISEMLHVELFNSSKYKGISASFKLEFVAQKNILYVFGEQNAQEDFAIIFNNTRKCKKVHSILIKKGAVDGSTELIKKRFLPSLFANISQNNKSSLRIKEILVKWIKLQDTKEKEEYIYILKDHNVYNVIFSKNEECRLRTPRKRKSTSNNCKENNCAKDYNTDSLLKNGSSNLNHLDNGNDRTRQSRKRNKQFQSKSTSKILEAPFFEMGTYVIKGVEKKKLFIFPSSERKHCYEYYWNKHEKCFRCLGCCPLKKHVTAKIIKRKGNDALQLNNNQHVCEVREFKGIIEKSNFEVTSYQHSKCTDKLFLFIDESRSKCYEYSWDRKMELYRCCGCTLLKHSNLARICKRQDKTEFVLLESRQHFCQPREYNLKIFCEKKIIEAKDFAIFKNGIDKPKLIIFTSSEKNFCYEYYWGNAENKFLCCECKKKQKCVSAEVCENVDETKFLKLGRIKHLCEPHEYDPEKYKITKEVITEASNFKIFHFMHKGISTSRLIVFCATNKNLCYEYYWHKCYYICRRCPLGTQVIATVYQNSDGKEYLKLNGKHVCELREFDPENYKDDIIAKKSMYKITSTTLQSMKRTKHLILFTTEEKNFFYKYTYCNERKYYYCRNCRNGKIRTTIIVKNEGKEDECVYVSNEKHVCEPLKYTLLVDNNIVKAPNYQLIKRKANSKVIQRLVVFTNKEKSECFEYTSKEKEKYFVCNACKNKHKAYVYAKLIKNDSNEEYVELSMIPHKCMPIKFVPNNITPKIVKELDFKLFKSVYNQKSVIRLAIFDSKDRTMGYIYVYRIDTKRYFCLKCKTMGRLVTAKLLQDNNDKNYLELNNAEHFCEPHIL